MKKTKTLSILFFAAVTLILFLSYYRNQWNIVRPGKFRNFQHDDQSLVMARLVESLKSGIFSYGGLLGRGDDEQFNVKKDNADYEGWYAHQYDSYLKGQSFDTYNLYLSQSGAQGWFFSALDKILPFAPSNNLRIFRIITSFSFALTLGFLMLWFFQEFGWLTALIVFITTLGSPWLTVFGRNLFYFPAFFYIPFIAATYFFDRHSNQLEQNQTKLGFIIFTTVLLKYLFNGFDFILPSILMPFIPLIYYAIRDEWNIRKFTQTGTTIVIATSTAIFFSLAILSIQLGAVLNTYSEGIVYILDSFSRRTSGNPQQFPLYAASLQANIWDVLLVYFKANTVLAKTSLRFIDVIFIFAVFTGIYFLAKKLHQGLQPDSRKSIALIIATWASIMCPLLWYVIFKGLAYIHTHTNFLSWYMPFTIFGFALCGYVLQNLTSIFIQKINPPQ